MESAARERLEQEQVWGLHRREEEARAERSERRSTALERRVAALQEELAGVGKSLAEGGEDGGRGTTYPILPVALRVHVLTLRVDTQVRASSRSVSS